MSPSGDVTAGADVTDKADVINRADVTDRADVTVGAPLSASTPFEKRVTNGYHKRRERLDNRKDSCDTINGNVHVNIVSASTNNMDVLSGGESDAGDTLTRRNNNNISSGIVTDSKRRGTDVMYYVAKELLMTERTYKRDLELVTVSWSQRVGAMGGGSTAAALARACLALEPLALPAGKLLARLERALSAPDHADELELKSLLALPAGPLIAYLDRFLSSLDLPSKDYDSEEPEYKKIAELLYEYLSNTFDAYSEYTQQAGAIVALVESSRRRGGEGARQAAAFDAASPLPLACLLLRPLHRLPHYRRLAHELWSCTHSETAKQAHELAIQMASAATEQLRHVENHSALCQLQRDIAGYDKLLVADREFVRLGCVYKHSSKGLQQRMLFLFSDLLIVSSKGAGGEFRAQYALPLHTLTVELADLPHSLLVTGEDVSMTLSASNESEHRGWYDALRASISAARENPTEVDAQLTPSLHEYSEGAVGATTSCGAAGGGLVHVCWHRTTALPRNRLHLAMQSQLSGYLLRKFKNSHGWQKLWVVFALFTLYFYKTCRDPAPLASLPLLGYTVGAPAPSDGIEKDFVFKLQFKNHVYFFRADSHFTYKRWIEVLQTPMVQN